MGDLSIEVSDLIIDCVDPERVAEFWSALLGRRIGARIGPYVFLERPPGQPGFGFQRTSEPKTGKNRLHLDLRTADPIAAQHRVEELGGRRVPGYEAGGFLVMADPEGNEFCILPEDPVDLDDSGKAHYLPHFHQASSPA